MHLHANNFFKFTNDDDFFEVLEVSFVNKKINTTEEFVKGIVNIGKNQLIFNDSPGISYARLTDNKSKKLKKNLWEALNNCDLILYIIEV